VRNGAVKELTTAVLALARDPAARAAMARATRELVGACFSYGRIAVDFEALRIGRSGAHRACRVAVQ
jgi:hypothetical protein